MSVNSPVDPGLHEFSLDARHMTRSTINAIRVALGISGAVGLILGIVLLFWPDKTIAVFAVFLGIYFLVAGVLRLGVGIFSREMRGGSRALNIILGIVFIAVGILSLKNVSTTAIALLIFTVAFIGVGWIIEGVMALAEAGRSPSSGWSIAFGILSILAGIVVLVLPVSSAAFLLLFAAIALIVLGIVGIVRAFTFGREILKATETGTAAPSVA
ncbi:HdeD family acid-resistance protein [Leifsonia sp. LS-T14]|uniref:HdeD family acid-resistance protein n=1 Tax=unclassified Leifsonia TaxID=2663824 RepID=UPI0035A581F1